MDSICLRITWNKFSSEIKWILPYVKSICLTDKRASRNGIPNHFERMKIEFIIRLHHHFLMPRNLFISAAHCLRLTCMICCRHIQQPSGWIKCISEDKFRKTISTIVNASVWYWVSHSMKLDTANEQHTLRNTNARQ